MAAPSSLVWPRRSRDPWEDPRPIRAEMFSDRLFERHATSLADTQIIVRRARPVVSLLRRLEENRAALTAAYQALVAEVDADHALTPAGEWLVDNFHAIEEHVRQARRDLPPGYFAQLPKLGPGFLEGHPRVFGIMWAYVAHTDSLFDPDQLGRYIRAYERRRALTLGELWAVAINLRILLIENARRLADQIVQAARERNRADEIADQLLGIGAERPKSFAEAVPDSAQVPVGRAFATQLLRRLTEQPEGEVDEWLDAKLAEQHLARADAITAEHQAQAGATVTMRNLFRSLRLLADVNWEDWLESVSLIESELRANVNYAGLDFRSRNLYRSEIEVLARGSGQDEITVARAALTLAAHTSEGMGSFLGYWLIDDGRRDFERQLGYRRHFRELVTRGLRRLGLPGYVGAAVLASGALVAAVLSLIHLLAPALGVTWLIVIGLLVAAPISDFALAIVNYLVARVIPTNPLPALALPGGIPDDLRTLVVVPTMLTSPESVVELVQTLEVHHLSNSDQGLYFAGLTDWADSTEPMRDGDAELLEDARARIRELNRRYPGRFLLFHRELRWNSAEGVWMGWERKRGKLVELNRYLRGADDTSFLPVEGSLPGPFKYVITLDADTLLPRETARALVGKLAHPLNQARFVDGRVVRGYTILQPRVTPSLPPTEDTSLFQRIYTTQQGLDPYVFAVSDVYQDLFDQGSFAGKGIYEVDAMESTTIGRIPENSVLSHDLLEGNYGRAGLVTDVEVIEEYPTSYEVAVSRSHRWTRGDWQLLPWLSTRRAGIDALGRWKMLDNLRRSLAPVALVLALLLSVLVIPPKAAMLAFFLMLTSFMMQPLIPLAPALLLRNKDATKLSQLRVFAEEVGHGIFMGLFNVVFLAHTAAWTVDAITRTLWRMGVSRRHLLEWTTAAAATKQAKGTLGRFFARMWPGLIPPAILALDLAVRREPALGWVLLPIALWVIAPVVAWRASQHYDRVEAQGSAASLAQLRLVARRTWHFFETFVTPEEHHLPPDNYQTDPTPLVANRTSPTNIGLYLLSVVSARDLGWVGLAEVAQRVSATLRTVEQLPHFAGHLYNWYDTRTLAPLYPRYVSTVDSGNLAGHLLTLTHALREFARPDAPTHDPRQGILDAMGVLRQELDAAAAEGLIAAGAYGEELKRLRAAIEACRPADAVHLDAVDAALNRLAGVPGLPAEAAVWVSAIRTSVASHARDAGLDANGRAEVAARLHAAAEAAYRMFLATKFEVLYDKRRRLFSIGYHAEEQRLEESCYDLLASECRLTSYLAIAKGDVRTRHWVRLGRSVTAVGRRGAALLSWSGSMFEYLMPHLVMRSPAGGLLNTTARRVVERQRQYGEEMRVPWGISESAYNARDREQNYQYAPFGVPGLGIVRGLADNLVIAPYATGLAAMIYPDEAADNYRRLAMLGARGRYGFHEAIDFTSARLPPGADFAIIRSYMAHHQGMTIVAAHEVILDGLMRERFHAEPMMRASELLLQERAPRYVPVLVARREEWRPRLAVRAVTPPSERVFGGRSAALTRTTHLMSNGSLSLTLTPAGDGQLRWRGLTLTRWHPDPTTPETGDYIYLRDDDSGRTWSATAAPLPSEPDRYEVRFSEDRARFNRRDGSLITAIEYHLSPELDALVRQVTLRNPTQSERHLTAISYAELVLARGVDDDTHPAFSKMFVRTEFVPELGAILATRRRRAPTDPEVWLAHFVTADPEHDGRVGSPAPQTDRGAFLGRNRCVADPAALDPDAGPVSPVGEYPLDPIASLAQRVRVPASGTAVLHFWTVAASSREEVVGLVEHHRATGAYDRVTLLAWTQSQVHLRHLGIDADEAGHLQTLAGLVTFPRPALRSPADVLAQAGPQSAVWSLGVSGDLPMVVLRIGDEADLDVARQAVRAFAFWRAKRFDVDLIFLNERTTSYVEELQHGLEMLAATCHQAGPAEGAGRVFVVRRDQTDAGAIASLLGGAAVVLIARRGDLADQIALATPPEPLPMPPVPPRPADLSRGPGVPELLLANERGGFTTDGREYVTVLAPGTATPAPWTNVIANPDFGCHATAEGAGYTWWRNSRDNQLTSWRNDPVAAPLSEAMYVRDADSGAVFSPTASPLPAGTHLAAHGFGYTRYHAVADGLDAELVVFVAPTDPVKLSWLRITNRTQVRRRLEVSAYAEPVLGLGRAQAAKHLITELDAATSALLVRNPWSVDAPQVVFSDLLGAQRSWTGDREEFLGRRGGFARPRALTRPDALSGTVGPGLDPCLAQRQPLELGPGQTGQVVWLLGSATDVDGARELIERYRRLGPQAVLDDVRHAWSERLGGVQVSTPEPAFDVMVNGWLLYQTLACRMFARSGYYQASGAYGFRDQLQDSLAVVLVDPELARDHLVRAAGRQFIAGDVQHWWLPADGRGIRTRISDDSVWLAYTACRYVRVTGDVGVLDEVIGYLDGPELAPEQHENFFAPTSSSESGTLFEHCVRGLRHAFTQGRHGLPLIGTGDWNDGFNAVGEHGAGESVWLGWFLCATLGEFLPFARSRDRAFARECAGERGRLADALDATAWDGEWYRRGYFDDGTPLGSHERPECQIDAIAQSWSVLSGVASPQRAEHAMESAHRLLADQDLRIVRLFTPAFDVSEPNPGYVRAYPPGVRENGGQYTHGALWSIFAWARLRREDRAAATFHLVNPVNHTLGEGAVERYRVEPYVAAADVYSEGPLAGRGGWTWYTGSSGWMYRAGLEAVLGLRLEAKTLAIDPCLPPEWPRVSVRYRFGSSVYDIDVDAPPGPSPRRVVALTVDDIGVPVADGVGRLPLADDGGTHWVEVRLG